MKKSNIKSITMFLTAYVGVDNYQKFGYTVNNIDKGYYQQQNILKPTTKTFNISLTQ